MRSVCLSEKKKLLKISILHELRRFYHDWYRPDLMAVIAVGDFDGTAVESLVKKYFSGIPFPENSKPRPVYPVPDHEETLYAIATDKENTRSTVSVYHKHPLKEQDTVGSYRQMLVENMYNGMLNRRFVELTQDPEAPFLMAFSSKGLFIRSKEFYGLTALVKDGGIKNGLAALFLESERVDRFGFTQSELDRQKADILRAVERAYTERVNTPSSMLRLSIRGIFLRVNLSRVSPTNLSFTNGLCRKSNWRRSIDLGKSGSLTAIVWS